MSGDPPIEIPGSSEWAMLDEENQKLKGDYAKLHGCVQAYIDAEPQVRGEAYRDLTGTMEHLAGADDALGWPAVWARQQAKIERLKQQCMDVSAVKAREIDDAIAAQLQEVQCVHCGVIQDRMNVEHWRDCPKHPAKAEVERLNNKINWWITTDEARKRVIAEKQAEIELLRKQVATS